MLLFQVGVAARQEVEVVQRRETVVARNGGLGDEVAAFRDQIVGEEGRNDRRPFRAEHLFAQAYRKAQTLGGAVADRHVSRQFDAAFVITDGHFGFVAVGIGRLLVIHRDNVFVDASYQMLVCRNGCREKPLLPEVVFSIHLAEEGVDRAARADHLLHFPVAELPFVVVGHPGMDITGFDAHFPLFAQVIPRKDAAQGLFALLVQVVVILLVIDRQHRKSPLRIDIPGLQSETVAVSGIVIDLLQRMEIVVCTAFVTFDRVVGADDVVVIVQDKHVFIVVSVLEVVRRGGIDDACRSLPAVVAVGEAQKLVESRKRADTLRVLQVETVRIGRARGELDCPAQAAARLIDRRGAVQQRGVVDEVGGDHREVRHAQHRGVDSHTVPRHLRMRG